ALSAITTEMNLVNAIYEREVAIRMVLIANETSIIYTDPAKDPYTNGDPSTMDYENQSNLDTVIGSANYDIGHVLGQSSSGYSTIGVVCIDGTKAEGATGIANVIGDPAYV